MTVRPLIEPLNIDRPFGLSGPWWGLIL